LAHEVHELSGIARFHPRQREGDMARPNRIFLGREPMLRLIWISVVIVLAEILALSLWESADPMPWRIGELIQS
jgi:hypothetical protein